MKTKWNQKLSICLILILVMAIILTPVSLIFASNSSPEPSGNSGGFIIETAKVDGEMDLIGALTGNITIYEGEIHGLTITKVIDRGKGLEPLVVRITSPGPIPVKNLHAQTMNHELPNIGGLCKPSKPGWICMENVVMNVEEQFVESIFLGDANVHTCYLSECGALPDYNPLISLEQLEEILNEDNDQSEDELQEILDLIEEQEELSEQLEGLLGKVSDSLTELLNQDYIGQVLQIVMDVEHAITSKLGLENLLPDVHDIPSVLEYVDEQLRTSTGLLEEGKPLLEGIEENIPTIEKMVREYEQKNEEWLNKKKQLGVYALLMELADLQESGREITYNVEDNLDENNELGEELQAIHDRIDNLKTKMEEQKKLFEQLSTDLDKVSSKRAKAEEDVNGLKALLENLGLGSDGDDSNTGILDPVEENVLDPVLDPVKENVLNPVKDKILDPVLDPVKQTVITPVKEKVLNPVKEKVLEPIVDPVTGKLLDPITGEVIDLVLDPVSEKLLDPITGEVIKPILNPLTGKIINPLTGEVVERVLNQDTGELLDPYKDKLLKRILEKVLNPFN
jgi:hypothetical protein